MMSKHSRCGGGETEVRRPEEEETQGNGKFQTDIEQGSLNRIEVQDIR